MAEATRAGSWGVSYATARRFLLAAGLLVLLVIAGVMYARRVDTREVVAVLLFIPVFVAFVFWDVVGGLVAALLASLVYVGMYVPAFDAVGAGRFAGLLVSRVLAYLAFGAIGGWANRQLEASLTKLDLYDQIDDTTGLNNARFFVQDTELEVARAKRYQTLFSVVVVEFPTSALDGLGRRQRSGALRGLGRVLNESVRTVDRVGHAVDGDRHRVAVVLPETAAEGARVFATRLVDWVADFLRQRGVRIDPVDISRLSLTYPDDETDLEDLRQRFAAIDREEHPEAAELADDR